MSLLFPRVAFAPVRCSPARHEVAPLWNLLDDTFSQLEKASRQSRRQFNPRFDVKEAKESYVVEGELPGFNPKDLSIEFTDDGHTLQIKGRSVTETESATRPETLEAQPEKPAVEAVTPESSSVKSHQATVEDESEAPANASAATATTEEAPAAQSDADAAQQVHAQQKSQGPQFKRWISERRTGEFSRSFAFPSRVDQEAVKASLKDGILSITLPFAPKPESRRINVE